MTTRSAGTKRSRSSKKRRNSNSLLNKTASQLSAGQLFLACICWMILSFISVILGSTLGGSLEMVFFFLWIIGAFQAIRTLFLTIKSVVANNLHKNTDTEEEEEEEEIPAPAAPAAPKTAVNPAYTRRVQQLDDLYARMMDRQKDWSVYLQEWFAGSSITIERYQSVFDNALKALKNNADKARKAAAIYGDTEATETRIQIFEEYIADSKDIVRRMENIIDALIKAQQESDLNSSDALDPLLDSLAETTRMYQAGK